MKLFIASALLLSLTKAAQSVKQEGKIHSYKEDFKGFYFPRTKMFPPRFNETVLSLFLSPRK